eukprot:Filipodium_phascolosomae@DN2629_c0_g1_i1.p1
MQSMITPHIILLKEGSDASQGRAQLLSNISACINVVDIVATTLGPRGMDKLLHNGSEVVITNDGATVMDKLNVVHPAAKVLVDIAKAQDAEVGDGTTSVVVIAGELLKEAKELLNEGMAPRHIMRGYRRACAHALSRMQQLQISLADKSAEEKRDLLMKCAQTSLNSKLVACYKVFFSKMIVDAVGTLDENLDQDMIGVKKVAGGSVTDSFLVNGVAFKKTFSYAGFEQQPKTFKDATVLLLNLELELKAEKDNAEVRIEDPESYAAVVDAEWKIIYEKLENIKNIGAQVVLSRLAIGDLATQYFADAGIFCAGRVTEEDMRRTAKATGALVQTTVNGLRREILGNDISDVEGCVIRVVWVVRGGASWVRSI